MTDIVMPQMGESIVEGTLTKWLKKKGEHIERDEPLFEISTDKVDTEIPSPVAGVLGDVLVQEGTTVAIGTVVGRIEDGTNGAKPAEPVVPVAQVSRPVQAPEPEAKPSPAPPPAAAPAPEPEPTREAEPSGPLSPLVRKMAREYNIDLRQVKGTGAGGRITKQDVEAYMSAQGARTMGLQAAQAAPPAAPSQAAASARQTATPPQPVMVPR